MTTFYTLVSLVVEGATWAACIFCLLRIFKKIGDEDIRGLIRWLSPVWAGASLVVVAAYSTEAFIVVYGANEYEGFSFVRHDSRLSQSSLFVQISLSVIFYLLPLVLLFPKARKRLALVYSITGLCFLGVIAVPRFDKTEPIQAVQTTPRLRSIVSDP